MPGEPHIVWTRRNLIGAVATGTALYAMRAEASQKVLGQVTSVSGTLMRDSHDPAQALLPGADLIEHDLIATGADSFAKLKLGTDTDILLGPQTSLMIDGYFADQGGELELVSGQMVFDRPEGLPKIDVSVRTAFGMIGVRGTKFFAGPNRGIFSVFVEHGRVEVTNAGVSRKVLKGEGVEVRPPDGNVRSLGSTVDVKKMAKLAIPTLPTYWSERRIREAYASVGLE